MALDPTARPHEVRIEPRGLCGILGAPLEAKGVVVFAHGSGSGRLSPRNNYVADMLQEAGIATLLLDLLTPEEENDRRNVFDVELLAGRLLEATDWSQEQARLRGLPIGYFGSSTGAGAALLAAAARQRDIAAVVSRGGRPDLAMDALPQVRAPTLLIVGERDVPVIELNRAARARLRTEVELVIVPNASHLFEEAGALDQVIILARDWFLVHFADAGEREARRDQPSADLH
jgi:pimeloyl-ACP methyl ester carboxylesterase